MHNIPLYSIFTATTEIIITLIVLYVIISNMRGEKLKYKLLFGAIAFEILVNVSYMVYRLLGFAKEEVEVCPKVLRVLAGFHGILSLVMLILLIILSYIAYNQMKVGRNFFKENKVISIVFIMLWLLSLLSGYVFFFSFYLKIVQ